MADEENDSHRHHSPTARRRLVTAACLAIAAVAAILLLIGLRQRPSVEEQVRAIDAAHAIPDEENAATDYTELVLSNVAAFLNAQLLPENTRTTALSRAWRSDDLPAAATWVEERREIIKALLRAGNKPRCWFPVSDDLPLQRQRERYRLACDGALLLVLAANRDLGEGRTEAGLEKLLGVFRLGEHFRSQLSRADCGAGMMVTSQGVNCLAQILVDGDIASEWLAKFEAALPPTEDTWAQDQRRSDELGRLYVQKIKMQRGIATRLRDLLRRPLPPGTGDAKQGYLPHLARFRAVRILLALRRYRNENDRWPANLGEIRSGVPFEAFLDPFTLEPFDYRLTESGFRLRGNSLVIAH
jgi:hypothetical protein